MMDRSGRNRGRVLVTGASGFVGSQCLEPLRDLGYEVHALRHAQAPVGPGEWHTIDLFEAEQVAGLVAEIRPSHLLHTAWITTPGVYLESPENLRWVEASLQLLSAFHASGGRRAVLVGTCFEYDFSQGGSYGESAPLRPATTYGRSKQLLAEQAFALGREWDIEIAWPRLFSLFGPREHPRRLVPHVILSLLEGKPAEVSAGDHHRDYMSSIEAGKALAAIVDHTVRGPVNTASGMCRPVRNLIQAVADAVGRPDLVRWGALSRRPGEPRELGADITRLRQAVGWNPAPRMMEDLRMTVEWWRSHRPAGVL